MAQNLRRGLFRSWVFLSVLWVVGSSIGGFVPSLWHAGMFSMWSIATSTIGGVAGIWIAYRLTR